MGFGKWILGAVGVAGAIIAAPVILPMAAAGAAAAGAAAAAAGGAMAAGAAAAAGTVAAGAAAVGGAVTAGAAAAAGTVAAGAAAVGGAVATTAGAVAAGASAVGGAVVGAATAAGGAVASTAVGGAVVSGAAAVGSAVGSAAGAVGLTSVATVAGTTTGAAAVGTIATSGTVAVASTAVGVKNMLSAVEIVENAERNFNHKKKDLDIVESKVNGYLNSLGELKLNIWKSFYDYRDTILKIKNSKLDGDPSDNEDILISKDELDRLEELSITAIEILKIGPSSLGVGALTGVAAYGGTMAIGTASTGTAIAGLSGAAASNAAMAALGGGSLASGGLGMAGGATVLGGLVAAPALAVSGLFFAAKTNNRKKEAETVAAKAEKAITKMEQSILLLEDIGSASQQMQAQIQVLYGHYLRFFDELKRIVAEETDYNKFSDDNKLTVQRSCIVTKILKQLTVTNIIVKNNDEQYVNSNVIADVLSQSKKGIAQFV